MRLFILSICCLFFWNNTNFKVLDSSFQKIYPGVMTPTRTTKYFINILAEKEIKELNINNLWIENHNFDFSIYVNSKIIKNHTFNLFKNDTLKIVSRIITKNDTIINTKSVNFPSSHNCSGLIEYKLNNKINYLEIEKFEKLEPLILP